MVQAPRERDDVSVPSAARAIPLATAAALPPEEPPEMRRVSHGLRQFPVKALMFVTPRAISCVLVLPRITAPAALSCSTAVASRSGMRSAKKRVPAVVRMPAVS
jgi:hypothetical protein